MGLTTELAKHLKDLVTPDANGSAAGIKPIEPSAPSVELPCFEPGDLGVMLKWRNGKAHEIYVVGYFKASQLRHLLEFGLRHIRACLHRGRPLNSPAQVANHKQGEI